MTEIGTYFSQNWAYIMSQLLIHLYIAALGVLATIVIGVPIGIWLARHAKAELVVVGIFNLIQTIPSIALLTILLILIGLGQRTVLVAVVLYSLLPIVKNTVVGLHQVDGNYLNNAKSLGMTRWQVLTWVALPLALPMILAGIRTALVMAVGVTAIGSFVGAGGLGDIILRGVNITNGSPVILVGSGLCMLVAMVVGTAFDWITGAKKRR